MTQPEEARLGWWAMQKPNEKVAWGITAAMFLVLLIAAPFIGHGSDTSSAEKDENQTYDARYMCEEFVKDRLKSPKSADFTHESTTKTLGIWTDTGTVDSDNSFGASIRNTFTCEVKRDPSDPDSWVLVSLDTSAN